MTAKPRKRAPAPGKPNRGGGRTKFRPEMIQLATNYCLLGATNADLARLFEVSVKAIELWISRNPEFRAAVKAGRVQADAEVAGSLYRKAIGKVTIPAVKIVAKIETLTDGTVIKSEHIVPYVEHFPPDTAAAYIWLKNRRPDLWREKHEVHNTGEQKVTFTLSPEAKAHLAEVRRLLGPDPAEPAGANGEAKPTGNGSVH